MTVLLEHGVESVLGNAMVPLSNTCMVTSENCEQPADLNAPARPKHFGTPLLWCLMAPLNHRSNLFNFNLLGVFWHDP